MFNAVKGLFVQKQVNSIVVPEKQPLVPVGTQQRMQNSWGLLNRAEGTGTERDFDSYNERIAVPYLSYRQIDELYRSNWMARKLIETPASDMTRRWREFDHEDAKVIEKRQKAEKRLEVKDTVRRAIQWADLYGGAAIILGLNDEDQSKPLNIKTLKKGDLSFLQVVFKDQIMPSQQIEIDPYSINFQKPASYTIAGSNSLPIHSSRVIQFYGAELPLYSLLRQAGWGDSKLTSAWSILNAAEKMWRNISQLISQANVDVIQIEDYMNLLARGGQGMVENRLIFQENMTSNYKKLILDTKDKYDRHELTGIQGLANIMIQFLQMVAGSAGMPLTKFLGTSIGGFSSGDNEITEWYDSVAERQNRIQKQMHYLDKIIEMTTFGEYIDIGFTWNSLIEMSDNEKADINLKRAQRDDTYLRMGIVDESMIAEELQNDGVYKAIDSEWVEKLKNSPPSDEDDFNDEPPLAENSIKKLNQNG